MKTSKKTKRLLLSRKKSLSRKIRKNLKALKSEPINAYQHSDAEGSSLLSEYTLEEDFQTLQDELFGIIKEELNIRLVKLLSLNRKLHNQNNHNTSVQPSDKKQHLPVEPTIDERFLQRIHDLVIDNLFDANFGNGQLAHKMFLSQSQLYRKIKALTGKSVAIHIRSIRLQLGKKMLESSQKTVSEVAYETGFTSPFYFSSSFSKEYGIAPSLMRDNQV
ncbi:MAG: AraC family transcriptional regulator [Saprospiraceae bacterium]|nr:AraC family transcriptional regulator [Saprospiraceae bacterium]